MSAISELLEDIDLRWKPTRAGRVELHVIGASALLLQSSYDRATKDSDVLETAAIDAQTKAQLLSLAGVGTTLARRHRLYVETVAFGLPFLPQSPLWHPLDDISRRLKHFDVFVLDIVDVVVSKLLRFSAPDRSDIKAMIDRELVEHSRMLTRSRMAIELLADEARADCVPTCIENFNRIERDSFGLDVESEFELPSWIDHG